MTSRPARVRTPGWFISWTALLFGLGFSVAANVAAAHPQLGPRLLASGAPVLALFAAGIIERVSLTGTHWIQRWAIVGGLLVVVAFAFITSYQHQQLLALEYGNKPLSADLYPIAVDALVLMSSVALAVIGQQRRAARAAEQVAPEVAPEPAPAAPGEAISLVELMTPREVADQVALPAVLPQQIAAAPVAAEVAPDAAPEPINGTPKATALPVKDRVEQLADLVTSGRTPKPAEIAKILGTTNLGHVSRTWQDATKKGAADSHVTPPGPSTPTPPSRPGPRPSSPPTKKVSSPARRHVPTGPVEAPGVPESDPQASKHNHARLATRSLGAAAPDQGPAAPDEDQ